MNKKMHENSFARLLLLLLITTFSTFQTANAAEWQWSVQLSGVLAKETNQSPQAFLWIPPSCQQVKAVVVGMHNMSEEDLFERPIFRQRMEENSIALIWITPAFAQQWDVTSGCQEAFDTMMKELADISGYSELAYAPIAPLGHSAMATFPWNFAAWNPERTLAIISLHGDAPRTHLTGYGRENLDWGRRKIDGIPGLMIEGEYEWWEERVTPALAFQIQYSNSCISFFGDAGRGHFDVADDTADYIALFLKKALKYRLPDGYSQDEAPVLKPLNREAGWLAQRWSAESIKRPRPAPYSKYKGDIHDAFWYFDQEMAERTEARYKKEAGKEMRWLSFMQADELVPYRKEAHVKLAARFQPQEDGITFHLKAAFTDSLRAVRNSQKGTHPPVISRICGPVKQLNDTTFQIQFYRIGMENKRHNTSIYLLASSEGDKRYKSTVQEFQLHIPFRHTTGRRQHILFPGIEEVKVGTESISLLATSDCNLPVSYYVKEGPAEVVGDKLQFTEIPPRSKFPIKITVVAWQYGLTDKVQTAEPVERSFYLLN